MSQVKQILNRTKGDKVIWIVVLMLSFVSLLAVFSSTGSLAFHQKKNANFFLIKQVMVLGLGVLITYWVHKVNYTKFARISKFLYYISVPLLFITLFFGTSIHEGSRWISLPVVNITFQTSDLAKLALFMFLASSLSVRQSVITNFKNGFLPVVIPVAITCVLIAPANLSTALMLGATCSILFFIGRVRVKHLLVLSTVAFVGFMLLAVISIKTGYGRGPTWKKRWDTFTGSNTKTTKDKSKKNGGADDDYQVQQAKIAIAYGGFTGLGPGHSIQRNFLPHPYSDFIFAIILEEYGLLGGAFIVMLYLIFLWRSIRIFQRCPYAFGAFLAVGLSMTLVFQAMLNMAVNVHLVPVTGQTLPMISMGGSSIWFTSVAIGIILSVSKYVDEMEGGRKGPLPELAPSAPTVQTTGTSQIRVRTPRRPSGGGVPAVG